MKSTFSEILDAADALPVDVREELIEILQKRTVQQRREEIAQEIKNARQAHAEGKTCAVTSDQIMKELRS